VEQSVVSVEEQAEVVRKFLVGLLNAFGLEGQVATRVEGDIVYADVSGEQTEALIGPKGAILDAVLELCRTMVHRQSQAGARLRLDIAAMGRGAGRGCASMPAAWRPRCSRRVARSCSSR